MGSNNLIIQVLKDLLDALIDEIDDGGHFITSQTQLTIHEYDTLGAGKKSERENWRIGSFFQTIRVEKGITEDMSSGASNDIIVHGDTSIKQSQSDSIHGRSKDSTVGIDDFHENIQN